MIRLEGVSYRYPDSETEVLAGVESAVEPGALTLVAGHSGAGKSTLLRSLNGLVPHFYGGHFSGRVWVDGTDTLTCRPRDLADRVGFVGQDPEEHAVAERLEDDIAFTLENLGFGRETMRKRIEEVLDALGISRLRDRKLETLSGGERQRAAIAAALVAMPAHLVLDEPTSQLDPQSAEEVIGAALRLRDEIGVTVVLAEQRLERVLQYAQELWVMNGGLVAGEPREVLAATTIGPPIVKLGRALGWRPLPLNLREARSMVPSISRQEEPEPPRPAPGEAMAGAEGLEVRFGGRPVLGGIDLGLLRSEVVALMGRNGSGKTTLLRALAGLIRPERGRVFSPGSIALVPQNPAALLFRSRVFDEIAATLHGRGREASRRAVEAEAEKFGLSDLLDRHPRDLSGGQRTRVAIAAAAAGDPDLILLDEPTRGMDEPGKALLEELAFGWAGSGRTVVLATHDVELAARVASRVVILSEGQVVVDAPPRSALARSLTFSTQMNKVFADPRVLTVEDALAALGPPR
ncbi:MAG: ABC transporter ATP-binding protein [Actinomycetota bacterium]